MAFDPGGYDAYAFAGFLVLAFITFGPLTLFAQEKGDVGLTMGYPASVGIIWHASVKVALRPEFSFSRSSTEPQEIIGDSSGWSIGTGLSALFYVSRTDNLRTYISPRYSYTRFNTTSTVTSPFSSLESELTSSTWSVVGSFGAQYSLSTRFSAFGEVGFGYGRGRSALRSPTSDRRRTTGALGRAQGSSCTFSGR